MNVFKEPKYNRMLVEAVNDKLKEEERLCVDCEVKTKLEVVHGTCRQNQMDETGKR